MAERLIWSVPYFGAAALVVVFAWLVQAHGRPEVVRPENDQKLKGAIFKALSKEAVFTTPLAKLSKGT